MPKKNSNVLNIRPPREMRGPIDERLAHRRLRGAGDERVLAELPLTERHLPRADAVLNEIAEWIDRYLIATTGKSRFPSNEEQFSSRTKLDTATRRLLKAMNADSATRMRIYHYLSDHSKLPERPPKPRRYKESLAFGRKLYRALEAQIEVLRTAADKSERMEDSRDLADPHVYLVYRLGRIWRRATGFSFTTSKLRDYASPKSHQIDHSRAAAKAKTPTARKFIRAVLNVAYDRAYDGDERTALDDIRDSTTKDNPRLDHAMIAVYREFYKRKPTEAPVQRYPKDRRRSDNDIKNMSDPK